MRHIETKTSNKIFLATDEETEEIYKITRIYEGCVERYKKIDHESPAGKSLKRVCMEAAKCMRKYKELFYSSYCNDFDGEVGKTMDSEK